MGEYKKQRKRQARKPKPKRLQTYFEKGEDGVGFVYGCDVVGRPDYFVDKVPFEKSRIVEDLIRSHAKEPVQTLTSPLGGWSDGRAFFWGHIIQDASRKDLIRGKCPRMKDNSAVIVELRPIFECSAETSWWGGRPPSPMSKNDAIVDDILGAWCKQISRGFRATFEPDVSLSQTKLVDQVHSYVQKINASDKTTVKITLSEYPVELTVALKHAEGWKVDWDTNLTANQVDFVKAHISFFRSVTRRLFRPRPQCQRCCAVENMRLCSGCKGINYCSRKCQIEDWESHKVLCKPMKVMRQAWRYFRSAGEQARQAATGDQHLHFGINFSEKDYTDEEAKNGIRKDNSSIIRHKGIKRLVKTNPSVCTAWTLAGRHCSYTHSGQTQTRRITQATREQLMKVRANSTLQHKLKRRLELGPGSDLQLSKRIRLTTACD